MQFLVISRRSFFEFRVFFTPKKNILNEMAQFCYEIGHMVLQQVYYSMVLQQVCYNMVLQQGATIWSCNKCVTIWFYNKFTSSQRVLGYC